MVVIFNKKSLNFVKGFLTNVLMFFFSLVVYLPIKKFSLCSCHFFVVFT